VCIYINICMYVCADGLNHRGSVVAAAGASVGFTNCAFIDNVINFTLIKESVSFDSNINDSVGSTDAVLAYGNAVFTPRTHNRTPSNLPLHASNVFVSVTCALKAHASCGFCVDGIPLGLDANCACSTEHRARVSLATTRAR
jgi:hypothetical protein